VNGDAGNEIGLDKEGSITKPFQPGCNSPPLIHGSEF